MNGAQPGDLLRRYSLKLRNQVDPRCNLLIDIGLVLDGKNVAAYADDNIDLVVSVSLDPHRVSRIYEVFISDDGSTYRPVFEATVSENLFVWGQYTRGRWEYIVAEWAKAMLARPTREVAT